MQDEPAGLPLLWHFPISHYNEKVRWALDWKGIAHRREVLALGYMPRAWWASGQVKLPILFLDGAAVADSTRIIAALERRQPEPALYPSDPDARARALALEDFFDEEVGSPLRTAILAPLLAHDPEGALGVLTIGMGDAARRAAGRIFPAFRAFYRFRHGIDDVALAKAPALVRGAFDRVQAELGPSGYLVADRFSVADLTAAAMLAAVVAPREHPHLPSGPLPANWRDLRASLADHPTFHWVEDMYRRHRGRSAAVNADS